MKPMLHFLALLEGQKVSETPPCQRKMTLIKEMNEMDQPTESLSHCRSRFRATVLPTNTLKWQCLLAIYKPLLTLSSKSPKCPEYVTVHLHGMQKVTPYHSKPICNRMRI